MNRRLLIAAACYADARGAIDIAERLVEAAGFDLGGFLMDDTLVRDMTLTPRQRVVTGTGAIVAAPDARRLQLLMASDARAFESHVSRIARAHGLSWRFERRSEDLFDGMIRLARGRDLLLIGHRRLRRGGRAPVAVISGGATAEADGANIAESLAKGLHAPTLTLRGDLTEESATALLDRVQRLDASLIVAEARGPFGSASQLRRLIDAARCPVLIACPAEFGARTPEESRA